MMTDNHSLSFVSEEHRRQFLGIMLDLKKIDKQTFDPYYAPLFYVLTADEVYWQLVKPFLNKRGSIDVEDLLKKIHFSSAYQVLYRWAGNLFSQQISCTPSELGRLDPQNYRIARTALDISFYGLKMDEVTQALFFPIQEESPA